MSGNLKPGGCWVSLLWSPVLWKVPVISAKLTNGEIYTFHLCSFQHFYAAENPTDSRGPGLYVHEFLSRVSTVLRERKVQLQVWTYSTPLFCFFQLNWHHCEFPAASPAHQNLPRIANLLRSADRIAFLSASSGWVGLISCISSICSQKKVYYSVSFI